MSALHGLCCFDTLLEDFYALQGLKDPEAKRKAIGAGFIEVFNDFAKGFERKPRFLVQVCTSSASQCT